MIDEIKRLIELGYGERKISNEIGISRDRVRTILKDNNISTGFTFNNQIEDIHSKVSNHTKGMFKYVSGFITVDDDMIIACNKCGAERKANGQFMRRNRMPKCYNCIEVENKHREDEKKRTTHINNIKRYIEISGKLRLKVFVNECSYCGHKSIDKKIKKHCSNRCMQRANELNKSDIRRKRIELNGHKENITLPKLFKRDKGVCHICKGKCDYSDYQIIDGHFCSGGNYPSRDHVIPLSKGGTHTWDNIKLAHFKCNTMKSDIHDLIMEKNKIRLNV